MKILGAWLIVYGILSMVLGYFGFHFAILAALDCFGPTMAWVLKLGLIGTGIWIWRRADPTTADEAELDEQPSGRAWVPVTVGGTVVLAAITYIVVNEFKSNRLDKLVMRPAPVATWASLATKEWPGLVLLQRAQFKSHSEMEAGCASLVRLSTGEIAALTAAHLLGRAGGVTPGFMRPGLGGIDPNKLKTLQAEITRWQLFLPDDTNGPAQVTQLYGEAAALKEEGDALLLSVTADREGFPSQPMDVRLEQVAMDEPLFVVGVELDSDGELRQRVLNAKRVPGLFFTCELEEAAELDGNSGAPILDKNGHVVGIVTGPALSELGNQSGRVRTIVARPMTELLPVLRAAVKTRGVTAPETKILVRQPKPKPDRSPAVRLATEA